MKAYKRWMIGIGILWTAAMIIFNAAFFSMQKKRVDRPQRVEIERALRQMRAGEEPELSGCEYIKNIVLCEDERTLSENPSDAYELHALNGKWYRFEYQIDGGADIRMLLFANFFFLLEGALVFGILFYIRGKILRPFERLQEVPAELAKGELVLPLAEEKTKFFGRFIWGINMLREHLLAQREKELALQKEQKTLLLSLTHDIRTPLAVIKLNAQALQRGLYKEEEKRVHAVDLICEKAEEMEDYVAQIRESSAEDFLDFSVKEEEFYLSEIMEELRQHYSGRLEQKRTEFCIEEYRDCILTGDHSRLLEVLQNFMENAIKYGDGRSIRITFAREEGCCLITVANTGADVKPEELPKLFDSFYRGSNVRSKDGSGLGLYICRRLLANMNGDIFVKQSGEEFRVTAVVRMSGVKLDFSEDLL